MLGHIGNREIAGQKAEHQNQEGKQQARKLRPGAHARQTHDALPAQASTGQYGKRGQHVDHETE